MRSISSSSRKILTNRFTLVSITRHLTRLGIGYEDKEKPGKSFKELLIGAGDEDKDAAVCVFDEYGPVRMIRNKEFTYVHRYPDGPDELYHLSADPGEKENLIMDRAYKGIKMELQNQLEHWFDNYVTAHFDGKALPVTGNGQIDVIKKVKVSFN